MVNNLALGRVGLLLFIFIYSGLVFSAPIILQIDFLGKTNLSIAAELAADQESRAEGLMNRSVLPRCKGMWFDFGEPKIVNMWMRDTLLPLDIIFFNKHFRVLAVYEQAQPLSELLITSPSDTQYVLEVNAGEVLRNSIAVGQEVLVKPWAQNAATRRTQCR